MISHSNGSAEWHREQLGIKTPEQKRIERLEADAKANEEQFWNLSKEIIALKAELAECKRDADLHKELIMAVAQKFHGETRHETALRYILDRERWSLNDSAIAAQNHCVETNNMVKGEGK